MFFIVATLIAEVLFEQFFIHNAVCQLNHKSVQISEFVLNEAHSFIYGVLFNYSNRTYTYSNRMFT